LLLPFARRCLESPSPVRSAAAFITAASSLCAGSALTLLYLFWINHGMKRPPITPALATQTGVLYLTPPFHTADTMLPWVSLALQPYWLGLQSTLFAWGVFCLVSVRLPALV
jgi:hypothetical protein